MAVAGEVRGTEQVDGAETDRVDLQREAEDRKARQRHLVIAAKKTVATFEGLLGKSIGFVHGPRALAYPDKLVVPFDDPHVYELTEHELSHIVFGSDAHMREEFTRAYVTTLAAAFAERRVPFNADAARAVIGAISNVLDDARVQSLWAVRYPGSAARIQSLWRASLEPEIVGRVAFDAGACLHARALGLDLDGPLTAAADAALERVRGRGYPAVLAATKQYIKDAIQMLGNLSDGASDNDRLTIAKAMLGRVDHEKLPAEDVQPTKDRSRSEIQESAETAQIILHEDAPDIEVDSAGRLENADRQVQETLERLIIQVPRSKSETDHVRDLAGESVSFERRAQEGAPPMSQGDQETTQHLRTLFVRELGRKREILDEYGAIPDVNAWIQRRIASSSDAVFRGHETARGFTALLLLDLSTSMKHEEKYLSAQRACRIVATALKFPFVDFGVWGFAGVEGVVHITRFSPLDERFDAKYPGGTTPTHVAIRAARAQLAPKTGNKHLFLVTDGLPVFMRVDGTMFDAFKLMPVVRSELDAARRQGIQVSTLVIDSRRSGGGVELSPEACAAMFGGTRTWRRAYADEFTPALVELIATTFLRHVRSHA